MLALALLLAFFPATGEDPTKVEGCCRAGSPQPWPGYNRAVVWTEDLAEAARRGRAEGKFLMIFRLVGDLRSGGT